MSYRIKFGVLLLVSILVPSVRVVAAPIMPTIIMDKKYGDDLFYHHVSAVRYSPDGSSTLVAGTKTLAGARGENPVFFLWELSESGVLLSAQDLDFLPIDGKVNSTTSYIKDIVRFEGGINYLLYSSQKGKSFLFKFRTGDTPIFSKEIKLKSDVYRPLDLKKIIGHEEDNLLILGEGMGNGVVFNFTENGEEVWSNLFDKGEFEVLMDGFSVGDGEVVLFGNSLQYKKSSFYPSPSKIWLLRISRNGTVLNEQLYPGRYGGLASKSPEKMAVVFDRSDGEGQDNILMEVNRNFEVVRETSVFVGVTGRGFGNQFFLTNSDDGYWVAGEADTDILVSNYTDKGELFKQYKGRGKNNSRRIRGVHDNNGIFTLVTRIYSEGENRLINYKVGLIKFRKN